MIPANADMGLHASLHGAMQRLLENPMKMLYTDFRPIVGPGSTEK
jgi:hypothetical protein